MAAQRFPTLVDVHDARTRIAPHLQPTPLHSYAALDRLVGARMWVKHENHQPVGAFKVRGGVNLVARLSERERARGVIAASTGNHGQSVAFAGALFGVPATVCVPEDTNPVKLGAMRDLGADVISFGRDFDEAREHCEETAAARGLRYIHSGNEPFLIAGVGTIALEMLEKRPDLEVLLVPVGGGSGAAGACVVAAALGTGIEVIGVQSSAAPTAYRSWRQRLLLAGEMHTIAEGLATRVAFDLPQRIMWEHLADFVLVTDEDVLHAQYLMIEITRNLVEAAAAAPLAAALQLRERLEGRTVGLVCTGGNVSPEQLRVVLDKGTGAL